VTRELRRSLSSHPLPTKPSDTEAESATPYAWRSSVEGAPPGGSRWKEPIPPGFLEGDCAGIARNLLGRVIRSTLGGEVVEGVVVETEAYVGPHDPASHAAERIGRTERNDAMFLRAGTAYVFRSYGVHWCLNVVTGPEGYPAAVLLRGLDTLRGRKVAARRRGGREPLGAGPGRLCQLLGVTGRENGHDLAVPPLQLLRGWDVEDGSVVVSGRIGIRHAADWPLRFYLRGHPEVSRG
jgi:DNA-3-methyladenine glycosylase